MPIITPTVFPFSALYVGDATSSAVLTSIPELRTEGALISENTPSDFIQTLKNRAQSGNHEVTLVLNFYSDQINTVNLSRGASIANTSPNVVPGQNQYSVLLVAPATYPNSNFYFPAISTIHERKVNYNKDKATITQITFSIEDRDVNTILYYQDSLANLQSIVASKWPL